MLGHRFGIFSQQIQVDSITPIIENYILENYILHCVHHSHLFSITEHLFWCTKMNGRDYWHARPHDDLYDLGYISPIIGLAVYLGSGLMYSTNARPTSQASGQGGDRYG